MHAEFLASGQVLTRRPVVDWRQLTVGAILSVTLAACAGLTGIAKDSPDADKVAAVTKQVDSRWAAMVAGDVTKSYSFLSAGSKASTSPELYRAKVRLSGFRSAKIEKVVCQPEICKVSVRVVLDTRRMKGLPIPETETWILENGEYRYVLLL